MWSPSTVLPARIDAEHAVGVAVEGEPEVVAARSTTVAGDVLEVGRAAPAR